MQLLLSIIGVVVVISSSQARVLLQHQGLCPVECFCPPFKEINCNDRHLSSVPVMGDQDNAFESYDLSGNNIEQIPAKSFENVGQLKYMDLRSNGLRIIDPLGFNGLDNLQRLHLDTNSLTSLHKGLFHLIPSLQTLTLNKNPLNVSKPIPFIPNLNKLDISHCKLRTLPPDFLAGVKDLKELILTNNLLESLPVDFFINLPNLKRVHLHGNPWRCDVMEDLLLSKQDVIADYNKVHCVTSDGEHRTLSWKQAQTTRVPSTSSETPSQGPRTTRAIVANDVYYSAATKLAEATEGRRDDEVSGREIIKDIVDETNMDVASKNFSYWLVGLICILLISVLISALIFLYRRQKIQGF